VIRCIQIHARRGEQRAPTSDGVGAPVRRVVESVHVTLASTDHDDLLNATDAAIGFARIHLSTASKARSIGAGPLPVKRGSLRFYRRFEVTP
jgi:hypothetical protein